MKIIKSGVLPDKPKKPTIILVHYAVQDHKSFAMLRKHFKPDTSIEIIDPHDVLPGRNWRKDKDEAIKIANCIVFLISADFYANDVIREEAKIMMRQRKDLEKAGVLLSLAVRPVVLTSTTPLLLNGTLVQNEADMVKAVNAIKGILSKQGLS